MNSHQSEIGSAEQCPFIPHEGDAVAREGAHLVEALQQRMRTTHLLREGLGKHRGYTPPALSDSATCIGGYLLDPMPTAQVNHAQTRQKETAIHSDSLVASMGEHFVDQARFTDGNIFLEIVQNAQALDSGGTWFAVEFYAKGRWYPLQEIKEFKDVEIKGARIMDNGRGFLPSDGVILGGTKKGDPGSAGYFGTGMKISDRSALERGVQVRKYSGNWMADLSFTETVTSGGDERVVVYNTQFFETWHQGSTMEYWGLTPAMVGALRTLPQRYLPLDSSFKDRLLAETPKGLILKPQKDRQGITVKGRAYELTVQPEDPFLFAYDLKDCLIDDQNRHHVDTGRALANIREIWGQNTDEKLFVRLLLADQQAEKCVELRLMDPISFTVPSPFFAAVEQVYGVTQEDYNGGKIFILRAANEKKNNLLKKRGYKGISCHSSFIRETLQRLGIEESKYILGRIRRPIDVGGMEDGEGEEQGFATMVCGALLIAKELGGQEEGPEMWIRCEDESETPLDDFLKERRHNSHPIQLRIQLKTKYFPSHYSWGGFSGIPREIHELVRMAASSRIDIAILNDNFEVLEVETEARRSTANAYYWPGQNGSPLSVTLEVRTKEQIKTLSDLKKHSLNLDPDYVPYEKTEHGEIVSLEGPALYQRGILRKSPPQGQLLLSYNLPKSAIEEAWREQVAQIVSGTSRHEVARKVLSYAQKNPRAELAEYEGGPALNPEVWYQVFYEIFGTSAVLETTGEIDEPFASNMEKVAKYSGLTVCNLNSSLLRFLKNCGVRDVFQATQASQAEVHDPNPMQSALLSFQRLAGKVISAELPEGFGPGLLPIKIARRVQNEQGQTLKKSTHHYKNPMDSSNATLYLYESIFQPGEIHKLIEIILSEMVEIHRPKMSPDEYAAFRTRVLFRMEALLTMDFFRKLKKDMSRSTRHVSELIDERCVAVNCYKKASEWECGNLLQAQRKEEKPKRGSPQIKERRASTRFSLRNVLLPVGGLMALGTVAVACNLVIKGMGRNEGEPMITLSLDGIPGLDYLKEIFSGLDLPEVPVPDWEWPFKGRTSFEGSEEGGFFRAPFVKRSSIGVEVEREMLTEGETQYRRRTFFSMPGLEWGDFMREYPLLEYDGKGWIASNSEIPDFQQSKWKESRVISHLQKLGKHEKSTTLRTRAGGSINHDSIRALDSKGKVIDPDDFEIIDLKNGEYELKGLKGARAVMYQTASPVNWERVAENLTDQDFKNLDPVVYNYYTQTPTVDLRQIKFEDPNFSQKNVQDLIDALKQMPPIQRIYAIQGIVGRMRYTITERTEDAFDAFHKGKTPEKDFLTFVLNSPLLENPGDGDCDVQNSLFALLARLSGIPSRLSHVIVESGVGHAPAEIFLPRIGWVLFDTMGERQLIEREIRRGRQIPSRRQMTPNPEDETRNALWMAMEYEARECSSLVEENPL